MSETSLSNVKSALAKYPCGPGGHRQRNIGIFFSGVVAVGQGTSLPKADKPAWTCEDCGIEGGFMTCIVCGGMESVTPQTISNESREREVTGELCMPCYFELMGVGVAEWRLGGAVHS